jgi:pyruvate ferredoxin oxidoreductase gamma subunit
VIEVRWHARAGQGAKTASQLLAMAELHAGRFVQAFPEYGPERGGAPMRSYTRIDDRRVRRRYGVTEPDVVVVIEPSLLGEVNVAEGLKPDGLLLVNLPAGTASPEWHGVVRTVDAGDVAKPRYVNAVMLGALAGAIGEPQLEELLAAARQLFGPKLAEGTLHEVEAAITDGWSALKEEVTA